MTAGHGELASFLRELGLLESCAHLCEETGIVRYTPRCFRALVTHLVVFILACRLQMLVLLCCCQVGGGSGRK